MTNDLTKGSLAKTMLSFSLPFLLSYFLQTLYGMADLFIVGQFEGVSCTTAVSLGSQIMHMLTVIIVGLAMGATIAIGKAVGAKKHDEASRVIGNTVILFGAVSLTLAACCLVGVNGIIKLISVPEEAVNEASKYLVICFIGIPFITAYNIISSVFRGLGDSKTPMYFVAASCIMNIALDYLFIGALKMGAAGAALGTVLSQTASVALGLLAVSRRKSGLSVRLEPDKKILSALLRTGIPVACQDGLIQVSFMVISVIANKRGLTDAAAVGVIEKVISFLFLVPSTLLSSVSAVAAQNIGAGENERAKKSLYYAMGFGAVYGLIVGIAAQYASESVAAVFTADAAVIIAGGQYLRSYVWDTLFAGIHFSCSGYFCAKGKSMLSFIHNMLSMSLVRIPLAWFLSRSYPETLFPMGFAPTLGSVLSVALCAAFLISMNKKEKRIEI